MSKSVNRSRRRANNASSMRSLCAGGERRGPVLLGFRKHLSQPGHGPVELVQAQIAGAFDGVVILPLLGGTVATGCEEAMQHGEEDGPLDGELEASAFE